MIIHAWPKAKNKVRNPYQFLLYRAVESYTNSLVYELTITSFFKKVDVFHIHWPDSYLASGKGLIFWLKLICLKLFFWGARVKGVPVVWTAHNFKREGQRNSDRLMRYFWDWFIERVDGIIFMTEASKREAISLCPSLKSKPLKVIPHGHYKGIITEDTDFDVVSSPIPKILFFGSITRYKNVHKLLRAFISLPRGVAKLEIRGKMSLVEPDEKLEALLLSMPHSKKNEVTYENRFLTDEELANVVSKATLVVFPYSDVFNSGAALYALSVGRPIFATTSPLFTELQQKVGEEWVILANKKFTGDDLIEAVQMAKKSMCSGAKPDLSYFNWSAIGASTEEFFLSLKNMNR